MNNRRNGRTAFALIWAAIVALMSFPRFLPTGNPTFGNMTVLFWLVVVAASLCVVTSTGLAVIAMRKDLAELGFVSVWFFILSLLPLIHGITTPGILYPTNAAFGSAVFYAGPLASIALSPMLIRGRIGSAIARNWTTWCGGAAFAAIALAVTMLLTPDTITSPPPSSRWALAVALPTVFAAAGYSWRHLQFALISRQSRYLVMFFGFAFTGVANLVWVSPLPLGTTFWFAHLFDIGGVFCGTIGGILVYAQHRRTSSLLGPILATDPLVALDLGLDPSVNAYMEALNTKDSVTRDHALRAAESAILLATELRLPATRIRNTGIAAVLHDIGKLGIPDEIINKPGALTNDEFAVMKHHTTIGYTLLMENEGLRTVAPMVQAHHERIDGKGYPNRLVGEDIPLEARIVSVCDAYDAMAHDRPYRQGMGAERAAAILQEHAGSQWDPAVVKAMVSLVGRDLIRTEPTVLDHLGHDLESPTYDDVVCGCLASLPAEAANELLRHGIDQRVPA